MPNQMTVFSMTRSVDPPTFESHDALRRSAEPPELWLVRLFGALVLHTVLLFGVRSAWVQVSVPSGGEGGTIEFVEVGTVETDNQSNQPKAEGAAPLQSFKPGAPTQSILEPDQTEVISQAKPLPSPSPEPQPPMPPEPIVPPKPEPVESPKPAIPLKPTGPLKPSKPITPSKPTGPSKPSKPVTPSKPTGPATSDVVLPEVPKPSETVGTATSSTFQLQDFTITPCQNYCDYLSYNLIQPPDRAVILPIPSSMGLLASGTIVVNVDFIVERPASGPIVLSKNGDPIASLDMGELKPTVEQQQNLKKAIQLLLEQCQFEVVIDSTFAPLSRSKEYVLPAKIQIQVS